MYSISGVHRSLFHPLATVRHRTWAGTWNKRNKQTQKLLLEQLTNIFLGELSKWTQKTYLCCVLLWALLPVFCSAVLSCTEQLLVQYAVRFGIPEPRRLIAECNICPLKLSTLKWPAQWKWTHSCKSSWARNEKWRHIDAIIPIFNQVLSARP
jgi:hypothetical protein